VEEMADRDCFTAIVSPRLSHRDCLTGIVSPGLFRREYRMNQIMSAEIPKYLQRTSLEFLFLQAKNELETSHISRQRATSNVPVRATHLEAGTVEHYHTGID
jgi:hypothetical protein